MHLAGGQTAPNSNSPVSDATPLSCISPIYHLIQYPLVPQIRVDSNNERSVHAAARGPPGPAGDGTVPGANRQRPIKERPIKKEKQEGPSGESTAVPPVVVNGVS